MKIAIIDVIGGPYDGSTIEKRGLGGSESAVLFISKSLAKLGFTVDVYNNCVSDDTSPGVYDNVTYIDRDEIVSDTVEYDVVISSRLSSPFKPDNKTYPFAQKARYKVLWLHDLFTGDDVVIEELLQKKQLHSVWTLSDFHTIYNATMQLEDNSRRNLEFMKKYLWVTRNGAVKWSEYTDITKKNKNKFVYSAASNKGMYSLLFDVWPLVKKRIPKAELTVIGGSYHGIDNGQESEMQQCINFANENPTLDISFTGIISQQEVANHIAESYMYLYPNAKLQETFCISAIESFLYKTPIICSDYGAMEQTALESCCYKLDYPIENTWLYSNINKEEQINKFVDTVVYAYENEYEFMQKQNACEQVDDPDIYSWDSVALQWKQKIFSQLGYFLDVNTFREVTKINHKVNKLFKSKFINDEVTQQYQSHYPNEKRIIVISPFWNAEKYINKCIQSVAQQDYENYYHILIDDCSDDNSYEVACKTIEGLDESIRHKFAISKNKENIGCIANQLSIFKIVEDDDIVVLLDGDDWLINNNTIFKFYNNKYNEGYDFTYGSCLSIADRIKLTSQRYPRETIENKSYRDANKYGGDGIRPWGMPYTHLRTFKGSLSKNLDEKLFKTDDGKWMKCGADNPLFYELIERSKKHLVVQDAMVIYNDLNPHNDFRVRGDEQRYNAFKDTQPVSTDETNIKVNDTMKKRILIAIPTDKYVETECFKSVYDLTIPEGYETDIQFFRGYMVDTVRNYSANYTIQNGYDYLFSVDSDIILPQDTLVKMLNAKKDIITGVYAQRRPDMHRIEIYSQDASMGEWQAMWEKLPDGISEIQACGFGCVLIDAKVLHGMDQPWFYYNSGDSWNNPEILTSEDLYFCNHAKDKGFKVWVDKSITCPHVGQTHFNVIGPEYEKAVAKQKQLGKWTADAHIEYMTKNNLRPKIVYDIGSCFFHFYKAIKEYSPDTQYYSVDASKIVERIAHEQGITFERAVLSDARKRTNFWSNDYNIEGDSCYKEDSWVYQELNRSIVETTTLDILVNACDWPTPDLMLIDVQGSEIDILKAAKETIKTCPDIIVGGQWEQHNIGGPTYLEVTDYMRSIGFEYVGQYLENVYEGLFHFKRI